ncbi:MAG: hypothetical protein ACI8RD_007335 [Bacillariaceae sp.]|jgi:hypothetical protein
MGIDKLLREACFGPRGVTMAGGSAGAIWYVVQELELYK